jgi:prepilin-type processing-associated H-X9-DG protein
MGFYWPDPLTSPNATVGAANVLPPIHGGVVIVTFCDGHTESLSADAQCANYGNSNVQ